MELTATNREVVYNLPLKCLASALLLRSPLL